MQHQGNITLRSSPFCINSFPVVWLFVHPVACIISLLYQLIQSGHISRLGHFSRQYLCTRFPVFCYRFFIVPIGGYCTTCGFRPILTSCFSFVYKQSILALQCVSVEKKITLERFIPCWSYQLRYSMVQVSEWNFDQTGHAYYHEQLKLQSCKNSTKLGKSAKKNDLAMFCPAITVPLLQYNKDNYVRQTLFSGHHQKYGCTLTDLP